MDNQRLTPFRRHLVVSLLGIAVIGFGAHGAFAVTFSDGTFNNTDWASTKILDTTPGSAASFTAGQVATGGNPGSYRDVTQTFANGSIFVAHLNNAAVYNPAGGAIPSVAFSYDLILPNSSNTSSVGYGGLAFQNGTYYEAPADVVTTSSWTHFTHGGLLPSSFTRIAGGGPLSPDFSTTGSLIQFGYVTTNQSNSISVVTNSGIDNWNVTTSSSGGSGGSTVPEPSTVGLLVSGLVVFALVRRRLPAR